MEDSQHKMWWLELDLLVEYTRTRWNSSLFGTCNTFHYFSTSTQGGFGRDSISTVPGLDPNFCRAAEIFLSKFNIESRNHSSSHSTYPEHLAQRKTPLKIFDHHVTPSMGLILPKENSQDFEIIGYQPGFGYYKVGQSLSSQIAFNSWAVLEPLEFLQRLEYITQEDATPLIRRMTWQEAALRKPYQVSWKKIKNV